MMTRWSLTPSELCALPDEDLPDESESGPLEDLQAGDQCHQHEEWTRGFRPCDFALLPPRQLHPNEGMQSLKALLPPLPVAYEVAFAEGRMNSFPPQPSRMPGDPPLYVGTLSDAANLRLLQNLGIGAVLNLAPRGCKDPVERYCDCGIKYMELDARDDDTFPLLERCFEPAATFISTAHADGTSVLVHCMAGVNRSAALAVAYLMVRDQRLLLDLVAECVDARPCILENANFQLQLCKLARAKGLLPDTRRIKGKNEKIDFFAPRLKGKNETVDFFAQARDAKAKRINESFAAGEHEVI
eukprot:CAMPEP_0115834330 /NCGR_PEP_ID=MMETSP0287-20121206/3628_1 /TAXON_ID=412157 /ORGANISM="Chrysochromulina rotalis, Strain UIO044" /LENGTH=299 /DNA_ID=CAMNT_0003287763 /DNA_START=57 /DNA_END=956 /DNA_ORIENTATION=+